MSRHRIRSIRVAGRSAIVALVAAVAALASAAPVLAADPGATVVSDGGRIGADVVVVGESTPIPGTTITQVPDTATFYGRGWGHGLGMSQWGARGHALAGETADGILAHYYPGTTLGTVAAGTRIRVLLVSGFRPSASVPARIYGRSGTWTVDGLTGTFPADASVTVSRTSSGWSLRVVSASGAELARGMASTSSVLIKPASSSTLMQAWFLPTSYDLFRGAIRLILGTGAIAAVNELELELYLRGVVPVEMPASWPAEALKSQAIAARSFAARKLRPGVGSYDVVRDTRDQAYRGVRGERTLATAAIQATSGVVVRSGSTIAYTAYHSTAGGATESIENVYRTASGGKLVSPISYLRGVDDRTPDGRAFDAASPHATWHSATYSRAALSSIFGADSRTAVGTLLALDLRARGTSGRLIAVTLIGAAGSKTVSGEVFRAVFNAHRPAGDPVLQSTWIDLHPIP